MFASHADISWRLTRRRAIGFLVGSAAHASAMPAGLTGSAVEAYRIGAPHLFGDERAGTLPATFAGALLDLVPHRVVAPAATPSPLEVALPSTPLTYAHDGQRLQLEDYFKRRAITGLLVIKDGRILGEHYAQGAGPSTRFLIASMSKSIIGILVGIAAGNGAIHSLDDPAKAYVPELARTAYGDAAIRDLLHMSSGVRYEEKYAGDGSGDLARLIGDTIGQQGAGRSDVFARYQQRRARPGSLFYYSSADTQALALVLAAATGTSIGSYMRQHLWQPMGAQDEAAWLLDAAGQEAGFAFMHATLRDMGRLGNMLAHGGRNGTVQVVPEAWLHEATAAASIALPGVADSFFGYGQHFWIFPGEGGAFALIGVRGQVVFVDPPRRLVLVQTAVWPTPGDRASRAELLSVWRGVQDFSDRARAS